MPLLEHRETSIYYEETGAGFPLLLIAPGGMNSTIDWWGRAAFDPRTEYAGDFRIVVMDQRNAGRSNGPLDVEDPWGSYVEDQVALVDHLGIERFLVLGCCIGCSYALRLIQRVGDRVAAAVLEQPIGIVGDNQEVFSNMWREWGRELSERRPDIDAERLEAFGTRMWQGEFVLSVPRELARRCQTPLLVLPGIDQFHPTEIGREVAELAPNAEICEPWKDTPELIQRSVVRVRDFLREHAKSE